MGLRKERKKGSFSKMGETTGCACVMNTIGQRTQTDNGGGREDGDGVMALGRWESVRSSTHVQEVV